jgi:fumarate hydratase class II
MSTNDTSDDANRFRIEHDSLGEVAVPAQVLYGAQTQRAVENFPVSGRRLPRRMIRALGLIKRAGEPGDRHAAHPVGDRHHPGRR